LGLLLPKCLAHLAENGAAAQLRRVLKHRRGGLIVQIRAMAQHHQRGIGKTGVVHPPKLTHPAQDCKPCPS
jgi:hypothetical protein